MSTIRRAAILKLATAAYEMELEVARGQLHRDERGRWFVGNHNLQEWLAQNEGKDLVFILGLLDDERPVATRTCLTCGRDYTEVECPHCRASRLRLRGRA
jgi:hypothetical protein